MTISDDFGKFVKRSNHQSGKLVMDVQKYADLLSSISQHGTGTNIKRPLSPVQCAKYIQRLIDEEQESLDKIAARLGIGKPKDTSNMYKKHDTSKVTTFLNLLKVSKSIQEFTGWQTDPPPLIPFRTIAQLSVMKPEEQDIIVNYIHKSKDKKRTLGKEDIRKIKKWRNENPDLSIEECIKAILKLKPVTIVDHVIVIKNQDKIKEVIESNKGHGKKILDMLRGGLPGKFYHINVGKSVIGISMDEEAYKIFHKEQYVKKSSYTKFLNEFLRKRLG